jgi:tetratricopeptide (TPR) repeat protein
MGVTLFELRRFEDSIDSLKQALYINPKDDDVYYYLGAALTELKRYDEAILIYKKALNQDINDGEIYYNLATVYAMMRKNEIVMDNLKKAVSIDDKMKLEALKNGVFDYLRHNDEFVEIVS